MHKERKSFCFALSDRPPPSVSAAKSRPPSTPLLCPFGRQPKTEISFGLCYNNDATNDDKKRVVGCPVLHARLIANRDAAAASAVAESFITCEHATRVRRGSLRS